MPVSVRTHISLSTKAEFTAFTELVKLDLFYGSWSLSPGVNYICYAYLKSDPETMANLTYINLKYETLEKAFYVYLNRAGSPLNPRIEFNI